MFGDISRRRIHSWTLKLLWSRRFVNLFYYHSRTRTVNYVSCIINDILGCGRWVQGGLTASGKKALCRMVVPQWILLCNLPDSILCWYLGQHLGTNLNLSISVSYCKLCQLYLLYKRTNKSNLWSLLSDRSGHASADLSRAGLSVAERGESMTHCLTSSWEPVQRVEPVTSHSCPCSLHTTAAQLHLSTALK